MFHSWLKEKVWTAVKHFFIDAVFPLNYLGGQAEYHEIVATNVKQLIKSPALFQGNKDSQVIHLL
jgi:hypothetical protein